MSISLRPEAEAVVTTFVAAYPTYVAARLTPEQRSSKMDDAIACGSAWLQVQLAKLLILEASQQRRGPLEVFQEALRFPNEVLASTGEIVPDRDQTARVALPGDQFGLAPASSQDLGEAAWQAHVAWGIEKAAATVGAVPATAVARRQAVVIVVGGRAEDRAAVERPARFSGLGITLWRNPAAIERGLAAGPPILTAVDLDHPLASEAITSVADKGGRVVAFGSGVDDLQQTAMVALGAEAVVERDQLESAVRRMLPTKV